MKQERIAELCNEIGMALEDSSADILAAAYVEKPELLRRLARLNKKMQIIGDQIEQIRHIMTKA